MERRMILTGLAALAATPVFAQSNTPSADAPAAPVQPTSPAVPAPAPAMKMDTPMSMSDAQTKHIKDTMAVGSLSLALSRVALPKVKHPMLKQFATFEIAEQETIADILKAMQMPGAPPSGTVKPPLDAELAGNIDAKGKSTIEAMHAMKAGPAFDRAYVKAQIGGHTMLLDIQEVYLKAPDNLDSTNVAKLAKGMIKEHLTLLSDLEKTG